MMIIQVQILKGVSTMKENQTVRRAARVAGVPLWRVAAQLRISEPTLTRWLRFPLPSEKEQRIMTAIQELAQEVG